MTSPVGVQSMNVGLREAHDLATLVADELEGTPGSRVHLQEYGQQRLAEWRRIFGIEGGLFPSDMTPEWLRPYAGELVLALPASGAGLEPLAASTRAVEVQRSLRYRFDRCHQAVSVRQRRC